MPPMELGFETIGNATVVVHDREPVLATDPWIEGSAYFGSWGLSHPVPAGPGARRSGRRVRCGSPTGTPTTSTPRRSRSSATPGSSCPTTSAGRIARDLTRDGYRVEVLPDATWVRISDRVRVLCIADEGQDAVLLVDVGGELVVNLNDAQDRGWGSLVKRVDPGLPAVVPAAPERVRRRRHDQLRRRRRSAVAEHGRNCGERAASRSAPTSRA